MAGRDRSGSGRSPDSIDAFLREILLTGPVPRKEIAARLGLAASTASRAVRALIDDGLVLEGRENPYEGPVRPGRRVRPLSLDPEGGQVIGITVAPTVQIVALADIARNVIESAEFNFEPVGDADGLVQLLAEECRRMIGAHLPDRGRLLGGLVMVTGDVDREMGSIRRASYLGWDSFPMRARFSELLNLPILVRPLTPTIGRAETLFGAARGRRNVLVMLCGIAVGAALLVEDRVVGEGGFPVGEIGKMTVTGADGRAAELDELAGGIGILRRLLGERPPMPLSHMDLDLHDAIERDRTGDPRVAALMADAGLEVGRLVALHGRMVRPELVLIAGPLAMSPSYMGAIRDALSEGLEPPMEVSASRVLGPEGGIWASCAAAVYEYLIERSRER